jgi:hypothetical protein
MTNPSKLDEARLRELAEACRETASRFRRAAKMAENRAHMSRGRSANETSIARLNHHRADLQDEAASAIDALSAERERGDRAVGLLRRAAGIAMVDGWATREMTKSARDTVDEAHAFLATQKAEGAET